jgi:hypothetical protein
MMVTTRVPLVAALVLVMTSPAAADLNMDTQCNNQANLMRAEAKLCGAAGGVVPNADARRCLYTHANDFGKAATVCVNVAESHYDASATLQGYAADRERIAGATFLGIAAEANIYFDRRDLASAQLKSVIKIASQVKADPQAADLKGMASSELAVAKSMLTALTSAP